MTRTFGVLRGRSLLVSSSWWRHLWAPRRLTISHATFTMRIDDLDHVLCLLLGPRFGAVPRRRLFRVDRTYAHLGSLQCLVHRLECPLSRRLVGRSHGRREVHGWRWSSGRDHGVLSPSPFSHPLNILSSLRLLTVEELTGPVMTDMYPPEERGKSLTIASFLPYLGPP